MPLRVPTRPLGIHVNLSETHYQRRASVISLEHALRTNISVIHPQTPEHGIYDTEQSTVIAYILSSWVVLLYHTVYSTSSKSSYPPHLNTHNGIHIRPPHRNYHSYTLYYAFDGDVSVHAHQQSVSFSLQTFSPAQI